MVTMAPSAQCNIANTPRSPPDVSTTTVPKKTSENRRSNKPIMEKRRRARINNSLNELKTLILDAMKKDPARHTKLEKADILEMAVRHLENLHKRVAATPSFPDKYLAGFTECASEVSRYQGLKEDVRSRLVEHLNKYLSSAMPSAMNSHMARSQNLQKQQLPSPVGGLPNSIFMNGANLQFVPTQLPTGEYALILPSSAAGAQQQRLSYSPTPSSSSQSPPPLNGMMPLRPASTDSATSASPVHFERLRVDIQTPNSPLDMCQSPESTQSSSFSSPRSLVHDHLVHDQFAYDNCRMMISPKPLALVVRESGDGGEQQCWRPW